MKQQINIFLAIVFIIISCNPPISSKLYDVVLYSNTKYNKTNLEHIIIVKSRLEIKKSFFEIGLIKTSRQIDNYLLQEIAAKNGANIIIDEGNSNYTLARYKNQKKKEVQDEGIKT